MFCPLLWIAKPEVDIGLSSGHDCLKEKCAWWEEFTGTCAIKTNAFLQGRAVAIEESKAESDIPEDSQYQTDVQNAKYQ